MIQNIFILKGKENLTFDTLNTSFRFNDGDLVASENLWIREEMYYQSPILLKVIQVKFIENFEGDEIFNILLEKTKKT